MRTSLTHPLQIAEIRLAPHLGKVGLTFCPGKKQPDAMTGGWDRDLKVDIDAVAAWNAGALLTLIEDVEMARLGVETIGQSVLDEHMNWYHLPIRDAGIPDAVFEEAWQSVGEELRMRLRAGSNVLVHCKGGLAGPG
ncbi:hypothetical protein [uncultured Croceicoccus sp.]|uniref:hypothetical protein n=1 Tax=uncultured Croceicoccus sp. TaxID=1295329 RepID=UPI002621F348|nr:hypothetical protein [uncultured Croceicoccus sp.]